MFEPFPLRPLPPRGGACPRDGEPLEVQRLRFGGWRSLIEGRCPACGHRYLQDLPTAHALVYPSTLDLDTGEAHGQWFETELREGWLAPDEDPVALTVEVRRQVDDAVLLDCLEPVYGHALLRLLNAERHLGDGLVVLVPAALTALVPRQAAEVWTLDEPLGRLRGRLSALEARIDEELDRFASVTLSPAFPHPHPSTFSLATFTGDLEAERAGEPSVVLALRGERLWGRSGRDQRKRFARTVELLRERMPELGAAAIGIAPAGSAPEGCLDLVSERPDVALERRWLALLRGADLALGVHGSNLLLPSGLARATLELLPEDRFDNHAQATLATDPDPLASLYRHRVIYGDADLRDVTPERVAAVAGAAIRGGADFRARHVGPIAGQLDVAVRPEEPRFADPPRPGWQPAPPDWPG